MNILVAGDFCPMHRVAECFDRGEYDYVLGQVSQEIRAADYSIVNFECPICHGGEQRIRKCGPNLKCGTSGLEAVKWAGFSCVTLANNHFLDYGEAGVNHTLDSCKSLGIDFVGGGKQLSEASSTLFVEINAYRVAIVNCCEHEFSLATEMSAGSNPLNPIKQYYAITDAKLRADIVLVIVHGGHEMFQLPSIRMQDTYRFFIDAGADAVVNHHQHCHSGYEFYHGKPIVYGLGNFCFDETGIRFDNWFYGMMTLITFEGKSISMQLIPYKQCKEQPTITLLDETERKNFENRIKELNGIITDRAQLERAVNDYYRCCMHRSSTIFEPWLNRYINGLQARGMLPSFISKKRALKLYGQLFCEAHRDKLEYYLQENYNRNK